MYAGFFLMSCGQESTLQVNPDDEVFDAQPFYTT